MDLRPRIPAPPRLSLAGSLTPPPDLPWKDGLERPPKLGVASLERAFLHEISLRFEFEVREMSARKPREGIIRANRPMPVRGNLQRPAASPQSPRAKSSANCAGTVGIALRWRNSNDSIVLIEYRPRYSTYSVPHFMGGERWTNKGRVRRTAVVCNYATVLAAKRENFYVS